MQKVFESKAADVFAFAMLAVEIFTGRVPFEGQGNSTAVCRIHSGDRPEFPQNGLDVGLTEPMRRLIQKCWNADPTKRPTIDDVVREWGGLLENNRCAWGHNTATSPFLIYVPSSERDPTPPPTGTERPLVRSKCLSSSVDTVGSLAPWVITSRRQEG